MEFSYLFFEEMLSFVLMALHLSFVDAVERALHKGLPFSWSNSMTWFVDVPTAGSQICPFTHKVVLCKLGRAFVHWCLI
jgi:hypothetical protein